MSLGSERKDRSFPAWVKRQGWHGAGGGGIRAGAGQWEDNWAVLGPQTCQGARSKAGLLERAVTFPSVNI